MNRITRDHIDVAQKLNLFDFTQKDWEKNLSQILADHFPTTPVELTEEEEDRLSDIIRLHQDWKVEGGYKTPAERSAIEVKDFLLSLIIRLRQQPERKAWLEKVAERLELKVNCPDGPSLTKEADYGDGIIRDVSLTLDEIKALLLSCSQEVEGGV